MPVTLLQPPLALCSGRGGRRLALYLLRHWCPLGGRWHRRSGCQSLAARQEYKQQEASYYVARALYAQHRDHAQVVSDGARGERADEAKQAHCRAQRAEDAATIGIRCFRLYERLEPCQ